MFPSCSRAQGPRRMKNGPESLQSGRRYMLHNAKKHLSSNAATHPRQPESSYMCQQITYNITFWFHELNNLIKNADVVRFAKSKRMAWLGHVMRMEGKRIPKRVLEWKPTGRRNRGRTRKRWIEDIEEDIQIMGIRGWRMLCKERAEWKKITEKAKTHSGL